MPHGRGYFELIIFLWPSFYYISKTSSYSGWIAFIIDRV